MKKKTNKMSAKFKRLEICNWIRESATPISCTLFGHLSALYQVIAMYAAPKFCKSSYYVNLVFHKLYSLSGDDTKSYTRCVTLFRFTRDKVVARWYYSACDDRMKQTTTQKGRLTYDGNNYAHYFDLIDELERSVIIGDLVSYSYNLGKPTKEEDYETWIDYFKA